MLINQLYLKGGLNNNEVGKLKIFLLIYIWPDGVPTNNTVPILKTNYNYVQNKPTKKPHTPFPPKKNPQLA